MKIRHRVSDTESRLPVVCRRSINRLEKLCYEYFPSGIKIKYIKIINLTITTSAGPPSLAQQSFLVVPTFHNLDSRLDGG